MKGITLVLFFLIPLLAVGQQSKPKSIFTDAIFKNLHYSYATIDMYYASSEIHADRMNGYGMGIGFAFNNIWMPGFSFEFFNSQSLRLDSTIPVINPRFNTSLIYLNNEFILGSNKVVSLGIPLRFGFGYTNYMDKYSDNNNGSKSIKDDGYFIADGGLNLYINILKCVSIAGGASYRYASGVQRVGDNGDFTNFTFSGKLRFRMFNDNQKKEVEKVKMN